MSLSTMDLSHESSLGFSQNPSRFHSLVKVVTAQKHTVELSVNLGTQNKTHNKRDYQYSISRAESDYRLANDLGKIIPSSLI